MRSDEACVVCGMADPSVLLPRRALPDAVGVLRCRGCGLVFLESRAGKEELDPEETAYWDGDDQKAIYLQDGIRQTFVQEFHRRLQAIERFQPCRGRLLDVGCGIGHFLDTARARGWTVKGLDISTAASQAAHEAYGLTVRVGTLESAPFVPAAFDVLTLWDVIEHIRRPVENLQAANRLLRMGGILAMKTPNEGSLFKWLARAMYRLFGERAAFLLKYVYYIPHYFSYSEQTMSRLLARGGFEVIAYEKDETPQDFASEKIQAHYAMDPRRVLVIRLLPAVRWVARLIGRPNKLVVYARKVNELNRDV